MLNKITGAVILLAIPALADPAAFRKIREKSVVNVVLPAGECQAKVVEQRLDQITLKLKKTTTACGQGKSLVTLSRTDVRDVVPDKRHTAHRQDYPPMALCAGLGAVATLPFLSTIGDRGGPAAGELAILAAGVIGGALLCRPQDAHYTVFTERISPAQP